MTTAPFATKLKKAREAAGYPSVQAACDALGRGAGGMHIRRRTMASYELGAALPPYYVLRALAGLYDASLLQLVHAAADQYHGRRAAG